MPRAVDDDLTLGDLAASQTLDALQPEALACFVARADALLECLLCLRTCPLHPDARLSWDAHADAVPRCLRLRDAPLQSNTPVIRSTGGLPNTNVRRVESETALRASRTAFRPRTRSASRSS